MTENQFWTGTKREMEAETDLSRFKTWDTVRKIPIYNPNEFFPEYSKDVMALMNEMSEIEKDQWKMVLKEPMKGHTPLSYRNVNHDLGGFQCTPWTLKTAHHIMTFEKVNGNVISDVEYDQVVDFGAGIGETARMLLDLGFEGEYIIYDLPEIGRVSKYYLEDYPNVRHVNNFRYIDPTKRTLFIATWSLSEVPYEYRDAIATYFRSDEAVKHDWLIIFQNQVFEYENQTYFIVRFPEVSNTFIRLVPIPWHGGGGGNFYVIARG